MPLRLYLPHAVAPLVILLRITALPITRHQVAAPKEEAAKVTIEVLGESGCPDTQKFIAVYLKNALAAPGISSITSFDYHPWGNAYFLTDACGGNNYSYNTSVRDCFNSKCYTGGKLHVSAPDSCFDEGEITCQHGPVECRGNRWTACARSVANGDSMKYNSFLSCVAEGFNIAAGTDGGVDALAEDCASTADLNVASLKKCNAGSDGDEAERLAAISTPEHPGVPWVLLNGKPLEESQLPSLLKLICDAYQGEELGACADAQPSSQGQVQLRGQPSATTAYGP